MTIDRYMPPPEHRHGLSTASMVETSAQRGGYESTCPAVLVNRCRCGVSVGDQSTRFRAVAEKLGLGTGTADRAVTDSATGLGQKADTSGGAESRATGTPTVILTVPENWPATPAELPAFAQKRVPAGYGA